MFKHQHPYNPYIPKGAKKLIIGTLPPPRFTTGSLKPGDIDFCYGSRDGQLWKIIDKVFNLDLIFENTGEAIQQRKTFLNQQNIGICDIIECAYREEINATDIGIQNAELRPIISILKEYIEVEMILFTGGNSKNGPEYFFRKQLKNFPNIHLENVSNEAPKIHQFYLEGRIIKTVSLTAPSGSANRAVGSMALYKEFKAKNPKFTTIDFRVLQYTPFLKEINEEEE